MIEPNPHIHHIFSVIEDANVFYDIMMKDESISEDDKLRIKTPRQAQFQKWIIDKIK